MDIESPIYTLPNEILCEIYNMIPKKSLLDIVLVSKRLSYAIPSYLLDHYRKYSHCMKEISEITYKITDIQLYNNDILFSNENFVENKLSPLGVTPDVMWKTKYSLRLINDKRVAFIYCRRVHHSYFSGFCIAHDVADELTIYTSYKTSDSEHLEGYGIEETIFGDLGI